MNTFNFGVSLTLATVKQVLRILKPGASTVLIIRLELDIVSPSAIKLLKEINSPVCTSSNSMVPLDWSLDPKILIPLRTGDHKRLWDSEAFPF